MLSGRVRAGASLVSGKLREPPGSPGSDGPGRGPVRTRVVFSDRGYPGRLCKLGCQVRARGTPTVSCPRPLLPEHRVCSFCDWTGAASPAGWAGRAGQSERPFVVRCALVAEPRGGHRPRPANGASRGSGQRGQVTSPQYTAHECLLGWNLVCLSVQHHSSGAAARGGGRGSEWEGPGVTGLTAAWSHGECCVGTGAVALLHAGRRAPRGSSLSRGGRWSGFEAGSGGRCVVRTEVLRPWDARPGAHGEARCGVRGAGVEACSRTLVGGP